MSIVLWSASAMVVTSLPLAGVALFAGRSAGGRASQNLVTQSPTMRESVLQSSPVDRLLLPVTRQVGSRLVRFTPIGWAERRSLMLAKAGLSGRVSADQVLGAKLLLSGLLAAALGLQLIGDTDPRLVLLMAASIVIGFFAPDLIIRAKADRRAEAITLALPDMLDQVTISVEAGLGLEPALSRTFVGQTDPLAQEFLRMLQDVRLGSTRAAALEALARRSQVEDLKSVVLSLRQADSLGVPLARTLRIVANEIREKRRYRAEARAQRLPTFLIFPLGLCILPALFIVILGPAIVSGVGT